MPKLSNCHQHINFKSLLCCLDFMTKSGCLPCNLFNCPLCHLAACMGPIFTLSVVARAALPGSAAAAVTGSAVTSLQCCNHTIAAPCSRPCNMGPITLWYLEVQTSPLNLNCQAFSMRFCRDHVIICFGLTDESDGTMYVKCCQKVSNTR